MGNKVTNKILEDHGDWLLVDISTPTFPDATMAIDSEDFYNHDGGRIYASRASHNNYIYAKSTFNCKQKSIHRIILNIEDGMETDHIKHGTMSYIDNRKSNLRPVTRSQNNMNRSGAIGVHWCTLKEKWIPQIRINNKVKYLGQFDNIEIAIGVRQQAEREYFGEYAYNAEVK